jgi:hypothetical protein
MEAVGLWRGRLAIEAQEESRSRGEVRALMTGAGLSVKRQVGWGLKFVQFTLAQK